MFLHPSLWFKQSNVKKISLFSFIFIVDTIADVAPPCNTSLPPSSQPQLLFPSGHHHTAVCVHRLCIYVLWLIPSPSVISPPSLLPSDSCQSVPCVHDSVSRKFPLLVIIFKSMLSFNTSFSSPFMVSTFGLYRDFQNS